MASNDINLKKIQKLVKSGEMSVNAVFACEKYSEYAIINSDEKLIDLLLKKKVNLNHTTKFLLTALHAAIKEQKLDVVKKLITSRAEINLTRPHYPLFPPLHLAIYCRNYDITEFLVMSGANVNADISPTTFNNNNAIIHEGSDEVYSSIHLAATTNDSISGVEILQILEKYGAKFEVIKDQEYTLEFKAVMRYDNVDILKLFSKNYDNFLGISDLHGDTVAHLAVRFSYINILQYLLNFGTNINVINDRNSSLLDIAMKINIDLTLKNLIVDDSLAIIKLIENHILKLSVAGIFVSKKNLRAVDGDFFKSFHEKCKKEISELKSKRMSKTNFNYYSVLEKTLHGLAVGFTHLDDCFDEAEIFLEFPLYGKIIVQKLRRAFERKELVKNAEKLYDIFYMELPDLVIRNIFNHLSNVDLRLLSQ
ncbi:hypothetical protein KQX54_012806 [Cotesia glomerata]|uniref:F-box domain-containing protein n=1 Tax=Cotesia glomerata TaxID=32391 RepID=A0AAV7IRN1_COTGL|nr:hypothetical protein KQX54_012806 [Cotesia glomerata]